MMGRSILILLVLLLAPLVLSAEELQLPDAWSAPQAIAFALRNSPDSRIAAARIAEAEAQLRLAQAANYPQLGLSAGYTQTDNPMHSFGNILNQGAFSPAIDFNQPGRTDNLNLTASLQYRFYNGGRDLARQQVASAGVAAAAAGEGRVDQQLGFAVFHAYLRLVETAGLVEAREAALEAIDSSLAVARARFEAGDLLKVDLLNLEVQQSRAHENHIQALHDQQLAQKIFLQLLGLSEREVLITESSPEPQRPADLSIDDRAELRHVTAELRAAEAAVRAAAGGRLPTIDGFASYQLDRGEETNGDGDSWMAGVKVDFKLFDGHRTASEVVAAEARLARTRAEKRKLELALGLELTRARLALDKAEQRHAVTRKMVEQAGESESLSRAQFRAGVILASDLIDSENRLTDARVRDLLAASAIQIAVADLRRSAGLPIFDE